MPPILQDSNTESKSNPAVPHQPNSGSFHRSSVIGTSTSSQRAPSQSHSPVRQHIACWPTGSYSWAIGESLSFEARAWPCWDTRFITSLGTKEATWRALGSSVEQESVPRGAQGFAGDLKASTVPLPLQGRTHLMHLESYCWAARQPVDKIPLNFKPPFNLSHLRTLLNEMNLNSVWSSILVPAGTASAQPPLAPFPPAATDTGRVPLELERSETQRQSIRGNEQKHSHIRHLQAR